MKKNDKRLEENEEIANNLDEKLNEMNLSAKEL